MAILTVDADQINDGVLYAEELKALKTPAQIGEGVERGERSKRKPFISVSEMLGADVAVGEVVSTIAYHAGGPSEGANEYVKVQGQTPTADGGDVIYSGDGNHFKGLFPQGAYMPEQWGARGNGTDDLQALRACNLSIYSNITYGPRTYTVEGAVPFPSRKKFRGVNGKTTIYSEVPNEPVACSQSYLDAENVSPTGNLDIDGFIFKGDIEDSAGQIAFVLRDFYSYIGPNCVFRDTRGGGLHVTARNDAGVSTSGTLVENRIEGVTVRNVGGVAVLLGANDNKVTDGYFTNCIVASNNTYGSSGIVCNNAAGWNMTGWHTYGADLSNPVRVRNCFNTKVDGYIESFTNQAANINVQRNAQVSLRVKTTSAVQAGASAVILGRSGAYPDANVKLDLALNHQNGDVDINGVTTTSNDIDADISVTLSGAHKDRVTKTKYGNINQYENAREVNANMRGRLSDNFQDLNAFDYNGNIVAYGSTSNKVINTFTHTFKLPKMRNFKKMVADVSILANRFDNGGGIDASYVGKVFISAKNNGVDNWRALLFDVTTPVGFSANPSVAINQTGDDEAELTISGTFSSSEYTGVVAVTLPAPDSPREYS